MKNKTVRLLTVSICCLSIPLITSAAQNNDKKKKQGQQQQQAQHPGQLGGKHQNAGNQNMMKKGNQGFKNPNNPNMANHGKKGNQGNKGFNHPNNPANPNIANQGKQWNKGNKGNKNFNNPNIANKNLPNNPNNFAGGKANKGKWETKHYNVAKWPSSNIKSVTFQNNYKINGAEQWQGAHYAAFRDYHSEWHDHDWWHNHYGRNLVLISGGWYFLNPLGYWAPAWGYNTSEAYYPYNGPIYAYHNLPPDQVIANVQASLQEQGYYSGEVDGLLGPLTQEALVNFQNSNGLAPTGSIDEPTLDSLGMS